MAETTANGMGQTTYGGTDVEPPATLLPSMGIDTIAGLIRKLRRLPSLGMLLRLLAVARLFLVVTDENGRVIHPMRVWDDARDGATSNGNAASKRYEGGSIDRPTSWHAPQIWF